MILLKNLSKVYGSKTVIKDVSMQFKDGYIYGLVGANGCGKTTLMRCICGFTQYTNGVVEVNGKRIGHDCDFPDQTGIILESRQPVM